MSMVGFFVYRSDLGQPDARPVLRWGRCPPEDVAAQATETGEVAVQSEFDGWMVAGIGGITPEAQVTNHYNPDTGDHGFDAVAPAGLTEVEANRLLAELIAASNTGAVDALLAGSGTAAWAAYRAALRDLPSDPDWPGNPPWPTPPS